MINIFYTNINKCFATKHWENYLEALPVFFQEYILKYQHQNDRLRVLCGKLLLHKLLLEINQENIFDKVQLDKFKRPYLSNNIDFNISHSGSFVVCCLTISDTNNKVGIDIEKKREINYEEFERVFTELEIKIIKSSPNPIDTFFKFWTMKEAVMKADGRGFHLSPKTFTVINNIAEVENKKWFLTNILIAPDYDCHLATEISEIKMNVTEARF